jgi:hypothetical protein
VRLTWTALLRGLVGPSGHCPGCGSAHTRPSREAYDGRLSRLLRVEARRCKSCHRHFAQPFDGRRLVTRPPARARSLSPRCPSCGGSDTLASHRDGPRWPKWLLVRQGHRCRSCRHRFIHTDWVGAATNVLVLAIVAGGLALGASYIANRLPQRPKAAPQIKSVPPLPPPAAR